MAMDQGELQALEQALRARARVLRAPNASPYAGEWTLRNPMNALTPGASRIPAERFRWSVWARGLSGEKRYDESADNEMKWFLEHAASPETGLLPWGEHAAWLPALATPPA